MDDVKPQKDVSGARAILRSLMSPWAARRALGAYSSGTSFGGVRDTYEALGYERELRPRNFRARYRRGGIAARIVEALPQSTWRGGGEIVDDDKPDKKTKFEEAFERLNKRLNIWQIFERADILTGLGRYSIIVLGAPGKLDTPLTHCKEDDLKYLMPFGEEEAQIERYDERTDDARFGFPLSYSLLRSQVTQVTGSRVAPILPAQSVHWSRVIHIADGVLDDPIFGQPRLERVWNLLDDLDKIIGGGAEAFWKRADGGTQFKIDPELEFNADPVKAAEERAKMEEKFDQFTHDLRKNLVTRGIDINRLGSEVADLKGPASAVMDQISATIGMPQRILMGSERGELASSKDKSNWDDRIQDRRKSFAEPSVVNPFIGKLIELTTLPEPLNDDYRVKWPEIDELDQAQRVAAAVQISALNKNEGKSVVPRSELRTIYLGLEPLTAEQESEIEADVEEAAQRQRDAFSSQIESKAKAKRRFDDNDDDEESSSALLAAVDMRALEAALIDDDLVLAEELVRKASR